MSKSFPIPLNPNEAGTPATPDSASAALSACDRQQLEIKGLETALLARAASLRRQGFSGARAAAAVGLGQTALWRIACGKAVARNGWRAARYLARLRELARQAGLTLTEGGLPGEAGFHFERLTQTEEDELRELWVRILRRFSEMVHSGLTQWQAAAALGCSTTAIFRAHCLASSGRLGELGRGSERTLYRLRFLAAGIGAPKPGHTLPPGFDPWTGLWPALSDEERGELGGLRFAFLTRYWDLRAAGTGPVEAAKATGIGLATLSRYERRGLRAYRGRGGLWSLHHLRAAAAATGIKPLPLPSADAPPGASKPAPGQAAVLSHPASDCSRCALLRRSAAHSGAVGLN